MCLYLFGGAHVPELANLLHASFYRSTSKFPQDDDLFREKVADYLHEFGIEQDLSLAGMFSLESVI